MPKEVEIWDCGADEGRGAMVTMYAIRAREAMARDPNRYMDEKPAPVAAKPAIQLAPDDKTTKPKK